jgi:hypothetical protein
MLKSHSNNVKNNLPSTDPYLQAEEALLSTDWKEYEHRVLHQTSILIDQYREARRIGHKNFKNQIFQ